MDFTNVGKKEPCPCGSGKKFKHCHGVEDLKAGFTPVAKTSVNAPGVTPEMAQEAGFDPNQMDPQMMLQFAQALQKLPKGQMQKLQSLMQKAMSGKDVSKEAAELEKTFPPEFMSMVQGLQSTQGASSTDAAPLTTQTPTETAESTEARGKLAKIWNKVMRR